MLCTLCFTLRNDCRGQGVPPRGQLTEAAHRAHRCSRTLHCPGALSLTTKGSYFSKETMTGWFLAAEYNFAGCSHFSVEPRGSSPCLPNRYIGKLNDNRPGQRLQAQHRQPPSPARQRGRLYMKEAISCLSSPVLLKQQIGSEPLPRVDAAAGEGRDRSGDTRGCCPGAAAEGKQN